MKKFLSVFFVAVLVLGALSLVSCKKSSTTSPTPAATATPAPLFTFETDQSALFGLGTADSPAETGISAIAWYSTVADAYAGSGSLKATASFSGVVGTAATAKGGLVYSPASGTINLANKTITVWVNIPAAIVSASTPYGFSFGINSNGWANYNQLYINITAAGWQKFTWDVATTAPAAGWQSGTDLTTAQKIEFQIAKGTGSPDSGACTINFDNIDWR
jgi:hypothetical protein